MELNFFSIGLTLFYLGVESIYSVLFMENTSTTSVDGLIHGMENGKLNGAAWTLFDIRWVRVSPHYRETAKPQEKT